MEIKTQYNIGDVVKLQASQTKFKVVGITACVKPDNDIIISYRLEHLVGKYVVGFNLENQLELPTETRLS